MRTTGPAPGLPLLLRWSSSGSDARLAAAIADLEAEDEAHEDRRFAHTGVIRSRPPRGDAESCMGRSGAEGLVLSVELCPRRDLRAILDLTVIAGDAGALAC
mmetsp:Transcript_524/g.1472  ORF Transcript_524/g.1472 Transcript_524/m.1472 type:complete len:102 (+) Transcript_524:118-423(+)